MESLSYEFPMRMWWMKEFPGFRKLFGWSLCFSSSPNIWRAWSPLICNLCATLSVCSRFLAHCVVMCFPTCPLKWLLSLVIRPHFGHCCLAPCARLPDLWGFNLCPCWALRFACVVKGWGVLPIWPAAQFERGFNWEGSARGDKR